MSHYDCPCMEKCPLHWAMSRIGGKWKVQILCSVANAGSIRYNTLRGKLDGISNTVLAAALRELERDGLVRRQAYPEVPVRVEYSPAERCLRLLPALAVSIVVYGLGLLLTFRKAAALYEKVDL